MVWGVSFALHERAIMDPRNANLAEYHVPVNADVPSLKAILVEEHDPHVNALGIKGVGEIGITGTAGAVANAVWHATCASSQSRWIASSHPVSIVERNLRISTVPRCKPRNEFTSPKSRRTHAKLRS
jgi:hypothetical protein